jgi:hypothetical protein
MYMPHDDFETVPHERARGIDENKRHNERRPLPRFSQCHHDNNGKQHIVYYSAKYLCEWLIIALGIASSPNSGPGSVMEEAVNSSHHARMPLIGNPCARSISSCAIGKRRDSGQKSRYLLHANPSRRDRTLPSDVTLPRFVTNGTAVAGFYNRYKVFQRE